jgi:DnaK suppressor protein
MPEWSKMITKTESEVSHLTEAEVLAMPAGDYMNAQQLEFFRRLLQKMRDELLENGQSTIAHLQETEATPDEADRATQEEEHVLEQRIRDRERKQLHKIDSALDRIANGTYGYCEVSGEPIGLRRLMARPTATLSIEEQERHERAERLFR